MPLVSNAAHQRFLYKRNSIGVCEYVPCCRHILNICRTIISFTVFTFISGYVVLWVMLIFSHSIHTIASLLSLHVVQVEYIQICIMHLTCNNNICNNMFSVVFCEREAPDIATYEIESVANKQKDRKVKISLYTH